MKKLTLCTNWSTTTL